MNPEISIITPSYNYARFLGDCLDSVLHQSKAPLEHLIIDDGSTDDSTTVISMHPGKHKLWEQSNAGLAPTLNRLVATARGEWVGWLNADDFYLGETIETVQDLLASDPYIDVVVGDTLFVDEDSKFLRLLPAHHVTKSVLLHYGIFAAPSSYFLRTSLVREIGFREDTKFLMDKWMFTELLQHGATFRYLAVPLSAMRRHRGQVSANVRSTGNEERAVFRRHFGVPVSGAGLTASRIYGRILHMAHKVGSGGYYRQVKWRRRQGDCMRWWR